MLQYWLVESYRTLIGDLGHWYKQKTLEEVKDIIDASDVVDVVPIPTSEERRKYIELLKENIKQKIPKLKSGEFLYSFLQIGRDPFLLMVIEEDDFHKLARSGTDTITKYFDAYAPIPLHIENYL